MREITITLHTLYGLNADTAACLGLGLLIGMGLTGILLVACAGFRQKYEWVAVGWSLLLSGLTLGGAFLGLSFTLHREDVTGLEQAAGISDITGCDWLDMRTARTITYTRNGEPYETRLLISHGRATIRIPAHAGE